ncbi:hypothetical protein O6H91_06G007800 [Diphasiastrum complanatum]|uniref:Uncharacterized protein n=1 Tax=Diphasiastrum complanatum TaxID=34168 RepID=A0ACC2DAL6_DIPCM|nr:hypothetical protein O6H91_06G007800 [Diphasiastrum complanatum]
MWRGEKTEYLRSNRDYAELLGDDHGNGRRPRSSGASETRAARMQSKDVSQDRQEYLDRRQKLKELERQKMKHKGGRGIDYVTEEEIVPKRNKESNGGGRMDQGQSHSKSITRPLPYDRSFGSFFGPSEPIVAKRIIEEARAREEAEIVAARARGTEEPELQIAAKVHSGHSVVINSKSANLKFSGYVEQSKVTKPIDEATLKAQKLKEARDYSFLFSDNDTAGHASESKPSVFSKQAMTCRSRNEQIKQVIRRSPPSRKLQENSKSSANQEEVFRKMEPSKRQSNLPKKQATVLDRTLKPKPPSSLPPKPKLISVSSSAINHGVNENKIENKPKAPIVPTSSKRVPVSRDLPKKVIDSGRPSNSLPSSRSPERKNIVSAKIVEGNKSKSMNRPGLAMAALAETVTVQKALPTNMHKPSSCGSGDRGRRVVQDGLKKPALKSNSERAMKKSAPAKSSLLRRPERSAPVKHSQSQRPDVSKKRRAKDSDDESEDSFMVEDEEDGAGGGYRGVSDYIRRMFGYNPNKYRDVDDGDDRDMEVGFNRIQAEERRSARIAREEDEREAQLLEEEERARKHKKLKMGKR